MNRRLALVAAALAPTAAQAQRHGRASAIITAREAEIAQMRALLARL